MSHSPVNYPTFSFSPPAEMILSFFKDEIYRNQMNKLFKEIIHNSLGAHMLANLAPEADCLTNLAYYAFTNGMGLQTLGEEYCGVAQTGSYKLKRSSSSSRNEKEFPLPLKRRVIWCWILLSTLFPYIIERSKQGWERIITGYTMPRNFSVRTESQSQAISFNTRNDLYTKLVVFSRRVLRKMDELVSLLKRTMASHGPSFMNETDRISKTLIFLTTLHLSLFYINGRYYDFSKRIFGIRYIVTSNQYSQPSYFPTMGYLLLVKLTVETFMKYNTIFQFPKYSSKDEDPSSRVRIASLKEEEYNSKLISSKNQKCSLCLENRKSPALTRCGHVFCWSCIISWCQNKPECPICRQESPPQTIRCLYRF